MPLIAVTRLRVRSMWFLPGFIVYSLRSASLAKRASGNLGVNLLRDANNTYWTCTAWTDQSTMRTYMMTEPHKSAMAKLPEWCNEAALVHWSQESAALPDWREAHRRMVAEGRRSRVNHPSARQEAFEIPEPKV